MTLLAAAAEDREAGPIGLVVILCLLVALIFLIRSMNKHLRKVPNGFSRTPAGPDAAPTAASAEAGAATTPAEVGAATTPDPAPKPEN